MPKKKEFKLTRKLMIFESVIVEAESKEAALAMYHSDEPIEGWEEEDASLCGEEELDSISERGKHGDFSIQHDVEEGEFV